MESIVLDVQEKGAKVQTGGKRIGNEGNFFEPTVLTDVPDNARILHEKPFGLASYAFTDDAKTATKASDTLDHGMVSIIHFGIALPETPFGGINDSGYDHEGGIEGLSAYLETKLVSHLS